MIENTLKGCRILVVEDEYMLADELRTELSDAGAVVLGPVPSVEQAIALIRQEDRIDGAILDINLGGELAYPVADLLLEQGISFVFSTGYDNAALPSRFVDVPRCEKPIDVNAVARALG
ncbi:response regulator [Rhizobium wenxiniae]|uniref:response regulator n=1 Tax=Rhizobium wenxiniae TaxID=1737357 RepID=UPI001C6DE97B|nr:response regulator [Rhizobium wenxiniae]MBW9091628.1 response regulator [Rhizobium wenxiniae]